VVWCPIDAESPYAWIDRGVAQGWILETSLAEARAGAFVRFAGPSPDLVGIYVGSDEAGTPRFLAPAGETLGHPVRVYEIMRAELGLAQVA
jgi:hypothetical protein